MEKIKLEFQVEEKVDKKKPMVTYTFNKLEDGYSLVLSEEEFNLIKEQPTRLYTAISIDNHIKEIIELAKDMWDTDITRDEATRLYKTIKRFRWSYDEQSKLWSKNLKNK